MKKKYLSDNIKEIIDEIKSSINRFNFILYNKYIK